MTDEAPDITGAETEQPVIEKSFTDSGLHEFNGFVLEPWTPARIIAGQAMAMHHGNVDEAGMARFMLDKVYPGAQRDVAIVLWLCTLKTQGEVDAAARAPLAAMDKVYAFAAEHQITDMGAENFWKGFLVFREIMYEVEKSRVRPEKKTTPDNPPTMTIPTT